MSNHTSRLLLLRLGITAFLTQRLGVHVVVGPTFLQRNHMVPDSSHPATAHLTEGALPEEFCPERLQLPPSDTWGWWLVLGAPGCPHMRGAPWLATHRTGTQG